MSEFYFGDVVNKPTVSELDESHDAEHGGDHGDRHRLGTGGEPAELEPAELEPAELEPAGAGTGDRTPTGSA